MNNNFLSNFINFVFFIYLCYHIYIKELCYLWMLSSWFPINTYVVDNCSEQVFVSPSQTFNESFSTCLSYNSLILFFFFLQKRAFPFSWWSSGILLIIYKYRVISCVLLGDYINQPRLFFKNKIKLRVFSYFHICGWWVR